MGLMQPGLQSSLQPQLHLRPQFRHHLSHIRHFIGVVPTTEAGITDAAHTHGCRPGGSSIMHLIQHIHMPMEYFVNPTITLLIHTARPSNSMVDGRAA